MLGLKLLTDPRWVNLVESNIQEILSDHAWCEQKTASNAISLITQNPEHEKMISELIKIAQEELSHFEMVHNIIKKRGLILERERKDNYVNELAKFMQKGISRTLGLVDRLLFSAMIEARSCERFKVLSKNISDPELSSFYHELMISEANHYVTFLNFAKEFGTGIDVEQRWQEWIQYETSIILSYGTRPEVHG